MCIRDGAGIAMESKLTKEQLEKFISDNLDIVDYRDDLDRFVIS